MPCTQLRISPRTVTMLPSLISATASSAVHTLLGGPPASSARQMARSRVHETPLGACRASKMWRMRRAARSCAIFVGRKPWCTFNTGEPAVLDKNASGRQSVLPRTLINDSISREELEAMASDWGSEGLHICLQPGPQLLTPILGDERHPASSQNGDVGLGPREGYCDTLMKVCFHKPWVSLDQE